MRFSVAWVAAGAILGSVGCAAILGIDDGVPRDAGDDAGPVPDAVADVVTAEAGPDAGDASTDAGVTCAPTKPFGAAKRVVGLVSAGTAETSPELSADELTIWFTSTGFGSTGSGDLFTATRAVRTDPFGKPVTLGAPPNSATTGEYDPRITNAGLTLIFTSDRIGNSLDRIYRSTRATTSSAWGAPAALALGGTTTDFQPFLTPDGKTLLFSSNRTGGAGAYDLWMATGGPTFGAPTVIAGVGSAKDEVFPVLSNNGLELFFGSNRATSFRDIYHATRGSTADPWSAPTAVTELDTVDDETPGWLSPDGCRLYFSSNHGGTALVDIDIFVAERTP